MTLPNFFDKTVSDGLIARINNLQNDSQPQRGKMNVWQMLAHCCVAFEYGFEPEKHKRPNRFARKMITMFAKKMVTGEEPFPKNSRTAPDMLITTEQDFATQKNRLIDFIQRTQAQGEYHYDGLESRSFGKLTKIQRSNLFYKHLDHHLQQFWC